MSRRPEEQPPKGYSWVHIMSVVGFVVGLIIDLLIVLPTIVPINGYSMEQVVKLLVAPILCILAFAAVGFLFRHWDI